MAKVDLELIQKLRAITGLGLMDCRKALEESDGDLDQAIDFLRKKGATVAAKRIGHETAQGFVSAYIHPGNQLGVLVELNCETDFVAQTDDMKNFVNDLCMHIAAMKPLYLSSEHVDAAFLERERDIAKAQLADSGKPEKMVDQIVDAKIKKMYADVCLLNQVFVKNDQYTITELLNNLMAKTGEKIQIKRFARFEIGA